MLLEALVIAGVGTATYTALDFYNYLPWSKTADGSFKPWWEKPPFVQPPAATFARPTMLRPTPQTPEQKIKMAQNSMAIAQRQIADANQQQMAEFKVIGQTGKYRMTKW